MQAKQYEERILKLQDALELQKLKNTSQLGRIRALEEQLEQTQRALEDERNEKEQILKNRRTNRLLLELQEERVQRLQDLEEIYAKDKQLAALASEVNLMTRGVEEAQQEITNKDAEVAGLRASIRCSAKFIQKAEKDFHETHRELEATQLRLLEANRRASEKESEVRVWIERYEQVMLDLHVAQFRLTQLARDASSKDAALTRGYVVDIGSSTPDSTVVKPNSFRRLKDVGANDRAVRKFRQDLIPNRSHTHTASTGSLHEMDRSSSHACPHMSRVCVLCNVAVPHQPHAQLKRTTTLQQPNNNHKDSEQQHGSKYLGYGLGLLKRDHIAQSLQST